MKHDPTTKEGKEEIKKQLDELKDEIKHYKELSEKDVDEEPTGPLTNPSEISIKRILKRHEDR